MKLKSAATIKINNASKMSKKGRKDVLVWLKRQVKFFEKYPGKLANRFKAEYLYEAL